MTHTNDRIEDRLNRLEKQNRMLRLAVGGLVMAALALGVLGLMRANTIPDLIEARMFRVVDESGGTLVSMRSLVGHGRVVTFDDEGRIRATVSGFGTVSTFNNEGERLVRLNATVSGQGTVSTYNGEGQELVGLGSTERGEGVVATYNGEGQRLVVLTAIEGVGALGARDPSGRREVSGLMPE